jgi:phosphoribosylglycinamide formyltransferase 1
LELRLGFLASHGGSNMSAILAAIECGDLKADPKIVISNNPGSKALQTAKEKGMPGFCVNAKIDGDDISVDNRIADLLRHHDVNLVILNGYMKKIGPVTLQAFEGRILNIHPSLLPKYGGQGMYGNIVHQAVLDAGESQTGATIHVIDGEYDKGRILGQATVPVHSGDTVDDLRTRVLAEEKRLYVSVLQRLVADEIQL